MKYYDEFKSNKLEDIRSKLRQNSDVFLNVDCKVTNKKKEMLDFAAEAKYNIS